MLNSLKKNKYGILLILLTSLCVCVGQLFWKISVDKGILFALIGFVLYLLGSLTMLMAYRFGRLSVLHPMLSLNYVLTCILAVVVLNESMQLAKIIGIVLIFFGVILIGSSDEKI